nr:hypothetical protein [uncultured Massilia sp.]
MLFRSHRMAGQRGGQARHGVLLQALRRGALNDPAMASLAAALAGHPVAPRVAQVQAAIGDFEFDSALEQLEAVMATLGE